MLDVKAAAAAPTPSRTQSWSRSLGTGSLELARGTSHVTVNGTTISGEQSLFFTAWDGFGWTTALLSGTTWTGGSWMGNTWTGGDWSSAE